MTPANGNGRYYVVYGDAAEIIKKNDDPQVILAAKTKFCGFPH